MCFLFVMVGATAQAQPLGIFRWQFQPFCNVVSFAIVQQGPVYALTGTDDLCGAARAAPATGTANLNPDGSISLGFSVATPAGAAAHVTANISLSGLSGFWWDADGHAGPFAFNGAAPGGPRPTPVTPAGGGALTGPGLNTPTTLSSQWSPSGLTETITTTVAGQLLISKSADFTIACTFGARWFYLTLNGFPLRSSVTFDSSPQFSGQLTGITDTVIQPGTHMVGVGSQCFFPANYTPTGTGAVVVSSSSIVVIQ